jgi:hypothetical protein
MIEIKTLQYLAKGRTHMVGPVGHGPLQILRFFLSLIWEILTTYITHWQNFITIGERNFF